MKKILITFSFALISGLTYFNVEKDPIILFVFEFSTSLLAYNTLVYSFIED